MSADFYHVFILNTFTNQSIYSQRARVSPLSAGLLQNTSQACKDHSIGGFALCMCFVAADSLWVFLYHLHVWETELNSIKLFEATLSIALQLFVVCSTQYKVK